MTCWKRNIIIMKAKIATISILLLMVLPVSFIAIRNYRHKHALRFVRKIIPYDYRIHTHNKSLKGYVLTAPYQLYKWNRGQLLIMDMDGKIYMQKQTPGSVSDFRQWKLDGRIYYSYTINDTDAYHIKRIAVMAGHAVILDSAFNEIRQIHLMPNNDITIDKNQALDLHDLILLSPDHYIAIAAYEKKASNIPLTIKTSLGVKIVADIIQEVDHGKVIWQWDASRYPKFYGISTEKNNFMDTGMTQDYMHINSMILDPRDSNLICSFRSTDQIIKISRNTGNILWRLGGRNSDFPLTDSQTFQRQHHATLTDDNQTLLILDNGDSSKRKTTRVLEFSLDEKKKKIIRCKSFTIPAKYNQFMGSVMKINDHYFIGGGTGKYILEIDPKTGTIGFDLRSNQLSYRAYLVDSLYGLEKVKTQP